MLPAIGELEILLSRARPDAYSIELRFTGPAEDILVVRRGAFALDDVHPTLSLAPREEEYGALLFAWMFAEADVLSTFREALAVAEFYHAPVRTRLLIDRSATELHRYRWEALRYPDTGALLFAGDRMYFSRTIASPVYRAPSPSSVSSPRVTVAISSPRETGAWRPGGRSFPIIDGQAEEHRIRSAVGGFSLSIIRSHPMGRPVGLDSIMDQLTTEPSEILYLVCHGATCDGKPVLYFETADECNVDAVEGAELVRRLTELRNPPSLIILASCQSAGNGEEIRSADDGALNTLGPALVTAGVPAVIAMQGDVTLTTASRFMSKFFTCLVGDWQIDRAVAMARGNVRDRADAWAPVLYMRSKSGVLLNSSAERVGEREPSATPARRKNSRALESYLHGLESLAEARVVESLSLSVREVPGAVIQPISISFTASPFALPRPSSTRLESNEFLSFIEAFHHLNKRVLLLGEPGAGKTTTLLTFSRDAARARRSDPSQPIPLLVNVRTWEHSKPLRTWALASLPSGIELHDEPILYLFDGLDELGGPRPVNPERRDGELYDPRERFLDALAKEFSSDPVVVTSRAAEYEALGVRAMLDGAVLLQPLSRAQVLRYVADAGLTRLRSALEGDAELIELARTPLLLTMLFYAFGGGDDVDLPEGADGEQAIFSAYVSARFRHETSQGDIPFSIEETTEALQDVAVMLCLRALEYREVLNVMSDLAWLVPTQRVWGQSADQALLDFARRMHFLRVTSNADLQFIHQRLRDFFALPRLAQLLRSDEPVIRRQAVDALVDLGPGAIPVLMDALEDQRNAVREDAAWGLHLVRHSAAVPGLVRALSDTDRDVRGWASEGIRAWGTAVLPDLIAELRHPARNGRNGAQDAIRELGLDEAVAGLINALQSPEPHARTAAAELLGGAGNAGACEGLRHLLQDTEPSPRRAAVLALARLKDSTALAAVLRLLDDPEPEVRRAAAIAVGQVGGEEVVGSLIRRLREEPDTASSYNVRASVVSALGRIGGVDARDAVRAALSDPIDDVRYEAANALKQLGDPAVIPDLGKLLKEDKFEIAREAAAGALGALGDPAAVPILLAEIGTAKPHLAARIAKSLGELQDERAVSALRHLAKTGEEPATVEAVKALGKIGTLAAFEGVLEILQSRRSWFELGGKRLATPIGRAAAFVLRRAAIPEGLAALADWPAADEHAKDAN